MPILDPVAFEGTLSSQDHSARISFEAGIDEEGGLTLTLDDLRPARSGTAFRPQGELLQPQLACSLNGQSADGWRFATEALYITNWRRPPDDRVVLEADATLATFSRDAPPDHQDVRVWYARKLGTFHGIERQTNFGRLVFTGYAERPSQVPSAVIALHAGAQEAPGWWDESERFLIHLLRVLSFASGVYVLPVYELSVRRGVKTLRVVRR